MLPNFKNHYKTIVMYTMWQMFKNKTKQTNQWVKIEAINKLIFDNGTKATNWKTDDKLLTNAVGKIECSHQK